MEFLSPYMWIVATIILIWFGIDCKKQKKFIVNKIEWFLYHGFCLFTIAHFVILGVVNV